MWYLRCRSRRFRGNRSTSKPIKFVFWFFMLFFVVGCNVKVFMMNGVEVVMMNGVEVVVFAVCVI